MRTVGVFGCVFSLCFATFENTEFAYVPIYEYACRSCEHRFETIQKASEAVHTDCPECGEATLRKLLSAPVFRLKGSGWYETDFKTGDKKNVSDNGESDKAAGNGDDGKTKSAESGDPAAGTTTDSTTKDTKSTDSKASSNPANNASKAD